MTLSVQGILMERAVGVQCAGSSAPSVIPFTGEERPAGCTNGISNSQTVGGSLGLQGNIQNISDRLQTLHDIYENRNQVNYSSCLEPGNLLTLLTLSAILILP
jgi:hypothetical protein